MNLAVYVPILLKILADHGPEIYESAVTLLSKSTVTIDDLMAFSVSVKNNTYQKYIQGTNTPLAIPGSTPV